MPESHEILTEKDAVTARRAAEILAPEDSQMYGLARVLAKSDIIPKAMQDKPANVFLILMKAKLLNISAGEALENVMVVNGRTAVWGDLFLALIQRSEHYEWHKEWYEGTFPNDDFRAVTEIKRRGIPDPFRGEFSIADAKKAKLWGDTRRDPWIKYPKDMLKRRARTRAGRDGFADALKGITTIEEARDIVEPLPVTGRIRFDAKPGPKAVAVEDVTEPKGGGGQTQGTPRETPGGSEAPGRKPPSDAEQAKAKLVEAVEAECDRANVRVPKKLTSFDADELKEMVPYIRLDGWSADDPLAFGRDKPADEESSGGMFE